MAVDADEFIVRWVEKRGGRWLLVTDSDADAPIKITEQGAVFGVVTRIIHAVPKRATA